MKRERIASEGQRPYRVSIYAERGRVWCKRTVAGKPRFKSWPDSRRNRELALRWARQYSTEPREPAAAIQAKLDLAMAHERRSVVYLIRCEVTGHLKIGRTFDLQRRLATLRYVSPTPLQLLGSVEERENTLEQNLHRRFAEQRLHGEWFTPVPEIFTAFGLKVPA